MTRQTLETPPPAPDAEPPAKRPRKPARTPRAPRRVTLELPALLPAAELRAALLRWYDEEHRPLPWRLKPSEYGTVVSEFMLQQTQVATVLPYFETFLKLFPNWKKLAEAAEQDVLRAWSGLGYYRRARMLKRVAEVLVREHGGRLPRDPAALAALPGFGEYTVGAVGSIALGMALPLVDGNVRRVVGRLFALEMDLMRGPGKRLLWRLAEALLDHGRPGDFNQSLMELGATVCLPREPLCLICPAFEQCRARQAGFPEAYPRPAARPRLLPVREVAVALVRGEKSRERVLVLQRGEGGSFAGMWELPRLDNRAAVLAASRAAARAEAQALRAAALAAEAAAASGAEAPTPEAGGPNPAAPASRADAVPAPASTAPVPPIASDPPALLEEADPVTPDRVLFDLLRVRAKQAELIGAADSTFTRYRIHSELYRVPDRSVGAVRRQAHVAHQWVAPDKLHELPASRAQRKLFALLVAAAAAEPAAQAAVAAHPASAKAQAATQAPAARGRKPAGKRGGKP